MSKKQISSALLGFDKTGLAPIIHQLNSYGVILPTGGTEKFIRDMDYEVTAVEELRATIHTGRSVKPYSKVFGGILNRQEVSGDRALEQFEIPQIDLVIVDLYPFEDTVATGSEQEIVEKIDIGELHLRAAAKNFKDTFYFRQKRLPRLSNSHPI